MAGVRRYEDLEAWQIADELKREVYALTETGPASKDLRFREQEFAERSIQCSTQYIVYLKHRAKTWRRRRRL
jgi:hypothetical protein